MKLNETLLEKISVNEGAGLTMMKFRFLYGGGIPTGNGNVYKASIIKSAVDNLNQRIEKAGPSYGMSGHKPDGELDAVSHLITKVETDKNGDAYATVKLLDTRAGKNLRAIIAGGGKLGVSARGHGSVKKDEKGHSVVGDDYRLDAVDFVMDPSVNGAWAGAENLFESAEILQPDAEEICALKYELAVRNSGYKGSYEDYKKNFAITSTIRLKPLKAKNRRCRWRILSKPDIVRLAGPDIWARNTNIVLPFSLRRLRPRAPRL